MPVPEMPTELWTRYEIGDAMGPFTVTSVEVEDVIPGVWIERVINDGGVMHQITRRTPVEPTRYELLDTEKATRVVIPFVPNRGGASYGDHHPDTVTGAPPDAEWMNVEGSDWNYWSLLCSLWEPNHNVFLIEHDVQYGQGFIEAFEQCDCLWGFHNYHHFNEEDAAAWWWGILGCTWFNKELIAKEPDLLMTLRPGFRHWTELSTGIGAELRKRGYTPHEHFPRVIHHRMIGSGL